MVQTKTTAEMRLFVCADWRWILLLSDYEALLAELLAIRSKELGVWLMGHPHRFKRWGCGAEFGTRRKSTLSVVPRRSFSGISIYFIGLAPGFV